MCVWRRCRVETGLVRHLCQKIEIVDMYLVRQQILLHVRSIFECLGFRARCADIRLLFVPYFVCSQDKLGLGTPVLSLARTTEFSSVLLETGVGVVR